MTGLVERDKHVGDDFAQAPVLSAGEDRVDSSARRTLIGMVEMVRVDGDIV